MNNKIYLQELAQGLAKRKKISRKVADAFLHNVFDIIAERVLEDNVVRVKGLGTFKVVTVGSRESVDVSTGERIVIDSHARITFSPQNTLRDAVNKAFADFETVVLNDETSTEEMERIPAPAEDEASPAEVKTAPTEEESSPQTDGVIEQPEETPAADEPAGQQVEATPMPLMTHETVLTAEVSPEQVEEVSVEEKSSQAPQADDDSQQSRQATQPIAVAFPSGEPARGKHSGMTWSMAVACFIMACLLIGNAFFLGYKYGASVSTSRATKSATAVATKGDTQKKAPAAKAPRQATPPPAVKRPEPKPQPAKPEPLPQQEGFAEKYPQVEGGEYWITGTREEHPVVLGDNLLELSAKVYGDKSFAQYIITYNNIKNPDILTLGTTLKLPELRKKE